MTNALKERLVALTVDEIAQLLATQGQRQYGREAVSQLDHALQCAQLAEAAGEAAETVVAALLHDLGHLLASRGEAGEKVRESGGPPARDDMHQFIALPFLRPLLPEAVLAPIRLHVDAKRYLCRDEPGYWDTLSAASKHSVELQGGVMDAAGAARFIAQPFAPEAARLRRYDDRAKVAGLATPPLAHFLPPLRGIAEGQVDHGKRGDRIG